MKKSFLLSVAATIVSMGVFWMLAEPSYTLDVAPAQVIEGENYLPSDPLDLVIKTNVQVVLPGSRYVLGNPTHAFQTFNNCGPASLSMLLSLHGVNISQRELGQELRPWQNTIGDNDDKSVTLSELAYKAGDLGFTAYHRPNGDIETIKEFIANDIPVITRTITKLGEDIGHYRVIYGYDDTAGQIIQNDSLQGAGLWYSYQDFLSIWRPYGYEYLVLVPKDEEVVAEAILGKNADELTAWRGAVDKLKVEINQNENDSLLRFSLSVAYYNANEYQKSVNEFEAVESELPFRALWYQTEPLLSYQKLGRYDELMPRIEKILNGGNRAFSELYQIRGEIYLDQGNVEAAREQFELAIKYNENYGPAMEALESI